MTKAAIETSVWKFNEPGFEYTTPGTLIFMNGVPLAGKTTVAPLVAASIVGCTVQNMDILRLTAQLLDDQLPAEMRNPVLRYGSCDGYAAVGDGNYSPAALLRGYRRSSLAACQPLGHIITNLEAQCAQNILFEGAQLLPEIVKPYLTGNNKLITITASEERLATNGLWRYANRTDMVTRYSSGRLALLQSELLLQAEALQGDQYLNVCNDGSSVETASRIIDFLQETETIKPLVRA